MPYQKLDELPEIEHSERPGDGDDRASGWFEIFRTGTHTDSQGRTREWKQADLEEIASLYNPAAHEAPIVIGHPADDAPAYGWIEGLRVAGDRLLAKPRQLVDEFKDMVKQGRYKKVSIALYPDMGLRHVGFLGAMPPSVKGLAQAAFSERAAWTIETEVTMKEDDRGWEKQTQEIGKTQGKGGHKMNKFKEFLDGLKALVIGAEKDLTASPPTEADIRQRMDAEFAEKQKTKDAEVQKREDALKAREEKIRAQEDALGQRQKERRKQEIAIFCETLLRQGKLTPAMTKHGMGLQTFLEVISEIDHPIEFGEPDPQGKKKAQSALEFMEGWLACLPKAIEFGEIAGTQKGPGSGGSAGEKLQALIHNKLEKKKDLSYGQAFSEVQREHPDIAREYQAEIR